MSKSCEVVERYRQPEHLLGFRKGDYGFDGVDSTPGRGRGGVDLDRRREASEQHEDLAVKLHLRLPSAFSFMVLLLIAGYWHCLLRASPFAACELSTSKGEHSWPGALSMAALRKSGAGLFP